MAEKYYGISPYAYCAGDPVNCVDPDGRWIHLVIGTAVGALIEGGVEFGSQMYNNSFDISKVQWGKVGVASGKGAIDGFTAATGAGLVAQVTVNVAAELGGQGVENVVGLRDGYSIKEMVHAGVSCGVSVAAGKVIGKTVEKAVAPNFLTNKAVQESKQVAKKKLLKDGESVSTANDPKVKSKAKTLRDEKIEHATNVTTNAITEAPISIGHKVIDESKKQ